MYYIYKIDYIFILIFDLYMHYHYYYLYITQYHSGLYLDRFIIYYL